MYKRGNTREIMKLMEKGQKQKDSLVRTRRKESYDNNVKKWKSQDGTVESMIGQTHWGYSPTHKSPTKPFKPQRLTESQILDMELNQVIRELEED